MASCKGCGLLSSSVWWFSRLVVSKVYDKADKSCCRHPSLATCYLKRYLKHFLFPFGYDRLLYLMWFTWVLVFRIRALTGNFLLFWVQVQVKIRLIATLLHQCQFLLSHPVFNHFLWDLPEKKASLASSVTSSGTLVIQKTYLNTFSMMLVNFNDACLKRVDLLKIL